MFAYWLHGCASSSCVRHRRARALSAKPVGGTAQAVRCLRTGRTGVLHRHAFGTGGLAPFPVSLLAARRKPSGVCVLVARGVLHRHAFGTGGLAPFPLSMLRHGEAVRCLRDDCTGVLHRHAFGTGGLAPFPLSVLAARRKPSGVCATCTGCASSSCVRHRRARALSGKLVSGTAQAVRCLRDDCTGVLHRHAFGTGGLAPFPLSRPVLAARRKPSGCLRDDCTGVLHRHAFGTGGLAPFPLSVLRHGASRPLFAR